MLIGGLELSETWYPQEVVALKNILQPVEVVATRLSLEASVEGIGCIDTIFISDDSRSD